MQDDLYNHDEQDGFQDDFDQPGGSRPARRIDPEKLALWSIPAGALVVAAAFMAGGWMATAGKPVQRPQAVVAPPPVVTAPQQPSYAVAPPPPPILNSRQPDTNVLITPARPAPPSPRAARSTVAPAQSPGAPGVPAAGPVVTLNGSPVPASGGFTLPAYRPPAGEPSPSVPVDEETLRLAQARAEMIREEQARIDRERAQRVAALDAARQAAANEARARQRARMDRGLLSPGSGTARESGRRHDAFFSDSDFRDEQSTWGRR